MSRPTVMTPEVIAKLEEAFKYGASDLEACAYADIAPATLYKYQEKNPEFSEYKEKLKSLPIFTARKSVVDNLPKDPELALKFLDRKKKDEFSTKTENDIRVKELPKPIMDLDAVLPDDSNKED